MATTANEVYQTLDAGGVFATTHWSVVLEAKEGSSPNAAIAMEKLCRAYWPPIYAYMRRERHSATDAQDLTQEFFARLLAKDYLQHLHHQEGKFPGEHGTASYTEIGARLGLAPGTIASAAHRLRKRHREILREEIARTVSRPEKIDEEIRNLLAILGQ